MPAREVRFATSVPMRSSSRKVVLINNVRGAVLATTRQCFWKRVLFVIGPFLPKRYRLPFGIDSQVVCGFQPGRAGQAPETSGLQPAPLPVRSPQNDSFFSDQ